MALSPADTLRIILQLIQTRTVTTEANYASTELDFMDIPTTVKWANIVIADHGPVLDNNGDEIISPTNTQKAKFLINDLRSYYRNLNKAKRVTAAIDAERISETSASNTETDTDLGAKESI